MYRSPVNQGFTVSIQNCKMIHIHTGWPKSNVSKVRAYYSAFDHLIRKIFSGVCRDSHWFGEYLKIIEIGDYFFE